MRVLITGGTGTFGAAMLAQLVSTTDHQVVIYSRDEVKQYRMLEGLFPKERERVRMFIGDVRDYQRLVRAFHGVDIVLHAAALKRIEVGHYNPMEMVKTNVLGTMNVVEAAQDAGVKRVVALSTDKAFQPVSPYGCSKAMAESLVLAANNTVGADGPIFSVTRYGNVAGSTGSVIPIWRELIKRGHPIKVTDPECTRFWMDIEEATNLVWDTALPQGKEAWSGQLEGGLVIPPHLPAYRIMDLAIAMTDNGKLADIQITSLPKWEKLHESMDHGYSSDTARRMDIDELKQRLEATQ